MSSIIVAINLIPEAISYGVMAGLGPRAALQSCWIANMATSLVGGRPGMISGASGLMALILSRLVQTGVEDGEGGMISGITFVPYAVGFAGVLQSISSIFGMGRLATKFPAPVVVGMVNAVALLTLAMQFRYSKEFTWTDETLQQKASASDSAVNIEWNIALFQYFGEGFEWITPYVSLITFGAEVALSLIVCTLLPRVTTVFPATLVSIILVVAVEFGIARQLGVETPLIRDYGGAQVSQTVA
jgi:SulP family sulfate permease